MNRKLPEYLLKLNTNAKMLAFVTAFSFVFIFVYTPFESSDWFSESSNAMQFLYSAITILGGVAILSVSRFILFLTNRALTRKDRPMSVLQYGFWLFAEILLIALAYTIFNNVIIKDTRDFQQIFQRAIIFIPLILFIPYTVSYLYFALKDKDLAVKSLLAKNLEQSQGANPSPLPSDELFPSPTKTQPTATNGVINFVDDKDKLQLSIKQDYVYYIESADNYVNIFYQNKGKIAHALVRTTLKSLEVGLEPFGFVRCHRSYLVNLKKVKIVRKDCDGFFIDLDVNGIAPIPISKTYVEKMMKVFSLNA